MTFWNKNRPFASIRIERKAYGGKRPTTYAVDEIDNIEELIRNMEKDPEFFITQHCEENSTFVKKHVKFNVKRIIEDETIEHRGKDIPVLAVASYTYNYRERLLNRVPWYIVGFLVPILALASVWYMWALATQKAETDFYQPPCTLFVEDNIPVGIQIYGESLHYNDMHKISDPIWEATATYDQLKMAYDPINYGCVIMHIDQGRK